MTEVSNSVVSPFTQSALDFVKSLQVSGDFDEVRESGMAAFESLPFPTRKTEDWKYTSLHALTQQDYNRAADKFDLDNASELYEVSGLDAYQLIFINGVFVSELSDEISEAGVSATPLSVANDAQRALFKEYVGNIAETRRNLFTALNNATVEEGVLLHVEKNVQLKKPIQVVNITSAQGQTSSAFSRCLVVLEQQAEATLIEQFVSTDEQQNILLNQVTEIQIGDGAKLNHYRLHTEDESSLHFGGLYVDLNRDSQFESYQIALGGKIKRLDVLVNHNQSGSHCEMKGVYLPKNDQHVDIHSYIEHIAANCTTDETYRGIMADQSKAVFNGRIHIHPDAQKTLANLSNKNLLLSNKAQINTKPELEIYADDVRCAHGVTVAQLDDKACFYLQSRGISRQEAEIMLSFAFINELLESIPLDALRQKLRPLLAQQFTTNQSLTQHILDDESGVHTEGAQ
jgi:Fe-S cluster assembly protein SufD